MALPAVRRAFTALLVALALVAAGAGVWVTATGMANTPTASASAPFGDVEVLAAEAVHGLDPHDLGGAAHGIGGLVGPDQLLVRVTVLLTGAPGDRAPVVADFGLGSSAGPATVTTGELPAEPIADGASVEATLGFVVPATAHDFALQVPAATAFLPFSVEHVEGGAEGASGAEDHQDDGTGPPPGAPATPGPGGHGHIGAEHGPAGIADDHTHAPG